MHGLVAGDGDEDIADLGGFVHGHHAEAVHHGFDALVGSISVTITSAPMALGAHGDAASAPAVAGDDHAQAGEQQVRRADDAVERGLAGAVAIVEEMLGERVVDGDDRDTSSVPSFAIARRRMTPVVVSSVPPMTFLSRSVRLVSSMVTRSAPSSMVICGLWSSAAAMCA